MNKTAKKLAFWAIIVAGVFLIQSVISIELIKLNLTLLLVYYFGLKKGELQGVAVGISVGFLEDTLSGQLIGPGMLGKGLAGILPAYLSDGFFIWTPLLGMLAVFALTIVDETVVYTSLSIFSQRPAPLQDFIALTFVKALINAPFGWLIRPEDDR
ncbi:MAG TPA: rod shape-determining protein MreD [Nitrospirae bacterium]|nr:rod shape-determining protein MreD [Nitrospirota bacterium]